MGIDSNVTMLQALLMAVLQGISELFPISSLGHAVIVPHLLGWQIDARAQGFLPFLVALHLGTATALAAYFWRDWWALLSSLLPGSAVEAKEDRRLLLLLVVGTVPAGLLGLIFEKRLAAMFGSYQLVAVILALNGILLLGAEWLRRRARRKDLLKLGVVEALFIGLSQAVALLPGFSRSGAAMAGGLMVGLSYEAAARFSFLLSTPIIFAAGVLELPKLLAPQLRPELGIALIGGVVAGGVAFASTWFLMRYFRRQEVNALLPFGLYCIAFGLLAFALG